MNEFLFSIRIRQNRQGEQRLKKPIGAPPKTYIHIRTYILCTRKKLITTQNKHTQNNMTKVQHNKNN